jgi:hypothetical protein
MMGTSYRPFCNNIGKTVVHNQHFDILKANLQFFNIQHTKSPHLAYQLVVLRVAIHQSLKQPTLIFPS